MSVAVLFVCLGNICRSPMAEAVMRAKIRACGLDQLVAVDSAGTGDWHVGEPPHPGTQEILLHNGIESVGLQARQIRADDLGRFDYLVMMDGDNYRNVERLARRNGSGGRLSYLLDYADRDLTAGERNVPDPYFDGPFDRVYRLVDSGCDGLLKRIISEHNLAADAA